MSKPSSSSATDALGDSLGISAFSSPEFLVPLASKAEASEQLYRQLVQDLPAAIYTCDAEGRIKLYNSAAAELWGREPKIGKDFWCGSWRIYRPDGTALPLGECPMAVALKEGRSVRGEEIVIERPDG